MSTVEVAVSCPHFGSMGAADRRTSGALHDHPLRHHAARRHPARRACPSRSRTSCASLSASTTSACTSSRAGSRGSNPKDIEFFERVRSLDLKSAVVSAFGSTRRKDVAACDDPGLAALLESGCGAVCIVGKAWDLHVTEALGATLEENLAMVSESVAYLKAAGRTVFFDAEHFFDGYAANPDYALAVCRAAADAGADAVVLCDTNGGTLPQDVARVVREVAPRVGAPLGIHAHNDAGCAVANALVAVEAGCTHVQGTINGYGERTGNADLTAIIPALVLKMGVDCISRDQLRLLTEVSHFVGRDRQHLAVPAPAVRGQERVRAQGRPARQRQRPARRRLRAHRPGRGGQPRARRGERTGRPRVAHDEGQGARHRPDRRPGRHRRRARDRQGARAPRLHVRGRRRLARDPDAQEDRHLHAAVHASSRSAASWRSARTAG